MKLFDSISIRRPRLNKFDLSHERKLSLNMAKLVPIMCQEVVPGDRFRVKSEIMLRMAPMLAPVMHRVNVFTHYFFVPNRLIWDEWEDFITGGREGTTEPVVPYLTTSSIAGQWATGGLCDYMGLPSSIGGGINTDIINFSALPFRAYQLIYDEYYRDQNLLASIELSKASGEVTGAEIAKTLALRTRCWEKDYFTSALPWAQRGGAVSAPITGDVGPGTFKTGDWNKNTSGNAAVGDVQIAAGGLSVSSGEPAVGIHAEIDGAGEITNGEMQINELRRALKLQEWLEKNARGGARYIEQILSHFGVKSSDARIQRPEYLGGGRQPVVISEVLSSVESADGTVPQANMAGHGVAFGNSNGFRKGFEEHGFIIGILSVMPKTAYQQGVSRMFRRHDKFDYFWPEFANIGEQEIKQSEIYYDPAQAAGSADGTFGYQSRYAEYKYEPTTVHGTFRSSLAFWHMGRIFGSSPSLNNEFVTADPTSRIFAVEGSEQMYCQLFNRIDAMRPMPYFGTPQL